MVEINLQRNDGMWTKEPSEVRREIMSKGSHRKVIAIDGPAAAGKTTVALALAGRVGAIFLDTGQLYRAVTREALNRQIDPGDAERLTVLVREIDITVRAPTIDDGRSVDLLVDGFDITAQLRSPEVERAVSQISAHSGVRSGLLPVQRRIADGGAVVMVGRDIGSVVVPDAGVKIYLDASPGERARRRHGELVARGSNLSLDSVLADLERRDNADSGRVLAPLQIAENAVIFQTDGLPINQVVDTLAKIVQEAWNASE